MLDRRGSAHGANSPRCQSDTVSVTPWHGVGVDGHTERWGNPLDQRRVGHTH